MSWANRAANYESTEWVQDGAYLQAFVSAVEFSPADVVLEVGIGTGVVARAVAPHVERLVGLDRSPEMLDVASCSGLGNLVGGDVRALPFCDGGFDKVLARMLWHHLVDGAEEAMAECYRVLRPGGLMVLSEGVPPDESLRAWYGRMFRLKERRLTFLPEDLIGLMQQGGFTVLREWGCTVPGMSVAAWLDKGGVKGLRKVTIMWMHRVLGKKGRERYNMVVEGGAVYCDFKFSGVVGRK